MQTPVKNLPGELSSGALVPVPGLPDDLSLRMLTGSSVGF
jgi:hypothetical protein